ncbi:MAG: class I SAM-dependent methyltransferase [Chloroflexi bacterium]|nr:class I SAM-dependent methyltransferase [Chloroflexota bacterium]
MRQSLAFVGSTFADSTIGSLYEFVGSGNYYTETTSYVNLGYWAGARTLDEASQALAGLLARTAQLQQGDEVLDVGFGFGDQDLFWFQNFAPRRITAINVVPLQVRAAHRRVERAGLTHDIRLQLASATELPFAEQSFDKVLALECAFHFETRATFFSEAMRVLRPGGTLVTCDLIAAGPRRTDVKRRLIDRVHCRLWRIPRANMYDRHEYAHALTRAGYANVRVESIAADVFEPYLRFCEFFARGETGRRLNPLLRVGPGAMRRLGWFDQYDYILARADKAMCAGPTG